MAMTLPLIPRSDSNPDLTLTTMSYIVEHIRSVASQINNKLTHDLVSGPMRTMNARVTMTKVVWNRNDGSDGKVDRHVAGYSSTYKYTLGDSGAILCSLLSPAWSSLLQPVRLGMIYPDNVWRSKINPIVTTT